MPQTNEWTFAPATDIAQAIRDGRVSAVETLEHYIARVESLDGQINAVIVRDFEHARAAAAAADRAVQSGAPLGPLHGVPMTVKEAFDVVGQVTCWGHTKHLDNIASTNATVVQRLLDAGAIVFGKTNVPVSLADWQSFNPVYGTTNNPWDLARGPGGSSGGSAAALAAGFTALEIGSDIGASIRNPAHYCGVYGHKPTFGVVACDGHSLPAWRGMPEVDIAVIGPMARSAKDLRVALETMAGPDAIDGVGWNLALPAAEQQSLKDFRVGFVTTDREAEVDTAVQSVLIELKDFLVDAGVTVVDDARPAIDSRAAMQTYVALLRSATSPDVPDVVFDDFSRRRDGINPDADDYESRMIRGVAISHREWCFVNETRHRMRRAWAEYFSDIDLLLCPAATTVAFEHNQEGERWQRMVEVNGSGQPSTTALFWAGYTGHVYLPSTVAPAGLSASGLPVGVQIVAPQYHDYRSIRFAELLAREFRAFLPPPAFS